MRARLPKLVESSSYFAQHIPVKEKVNVTKSERARMELEKLFN